MTPPCCPACRRRRRPVFREPWEAHAFAMAVSLHQRGLFTWPEWAEALARQIGARRQPATPTWATPTTAIGWQRWSAWSPQGREFDRRTRTLSPGLGPRRRPHAAWQADRASTRGSRRRGSQGGLSAASAFHGPSLNSITISLAVVAFVMGGALLGGYVRQRLPKHHLEGDTRDIVKAGIGLLATLSALVLGLIIASAKNSFDTKTEEVQTAAVKLLHLDRSLRQLGTTGDNARQELTQMVRMRVDQVWAQRDPMAIAMRGFDAKPNLETLQAAIR